MKKINKLAILTITLLAITNIPMQQNLYANYDLKAEKTLVTSIAISNQQQNHIEKVKPGTYDYKVEFLKEINKIREKLKAENISNFKITDVKAKFNLVGNYGRNVLAKKVFMTY